MSKKENNGYMSSRDTAEYLGMSLGYLYKLMSNHSIPYYKPSGKALFKKEELDAWVLSAKVKSKETEV